eukprot:scaffold190822_cov20-Prasinocladus_malaysianus.AAC.1
MSTELPLLKIPGPTHSLGNRFVQIQLAGLAQSILQDGQSTCPPSVMQNMCSGFKSTEIVCSGSAKKNELNSRADWQQNLSAQSDSYNQIIHSVY